MTVPVTGTSTRKEFGRGRVVYFSSIEFDGPLPAPESYFSIGKPCRKRPKNWKELVDATSWAARGDVLLQVAGPDFLGANMVEQLDKQRRIIHLVNYNTRNILSIESIEVKCALPKGKSASAVTPYSIDSNTGSTLSFRMQDSQAVFTVPKLNAYCMIAVAW